MRPLVPAQLNVLVKDMNNNMEGQSIRSANQTRLIVLIMQLMPKQCSKHFYYIKRRRKNRNKVPHVVSKTYWLRYRMEKIWSLIKFIRKKGSLCFVVKLNLSC